ncbi:MAG: MATE family efflux transporter [Eggerthella lenta]
MARGAGMAGSSSMARPFARYVSFNVLGMVGVSVYILADTFFIANGVGSDGLAALNFSIVLYTVLQATGLMLGIGAATEFQVCSACGDRTGANRVFTTALVMAGVAAAVLLAVVEAFAAPLSSLLGADEATLPLTVTYLRTIFAFAPLFLLNNVLLPFVRNDGSPQLAMVAMLVGSFGNIALDALFIFGFGWGMFGAAFATGFAPLMSMAVLLIHFLRKRNTFRPVRLHLRARLVGHIAALGFSSFVVELSGGLVLLVLNLVILAFEGTIGVAAYGVVANFAFVASALFVGIAQGIQPLASNAYARGSDRDVRAVLRLALLTALVIATTTYAAVALAAEPLALVQSRQRSAAHGACRGRHARVLPRVLLRGGEHRGGGVLQRGGEAGVWPGYLHRARSSGHARVRGRAGGAVRHGGRVGHVPRGRGGHVRADRRASRAVRARAAPARSGGGRVSPRQRAARGRASASRPVAPVEPV